MCGSDKLSGSGEGSVGLGDLGPKRFLDGLLVLEHLKPDVFCPVRRDRCEEKGLEFNELLDQVLVHTNTRSLGGLTVEVTRAGEVVEPGLES